MDDLQKFGRLTVIEVLPVRPKRALCRCECGVEKTVRLDHLKSGATQSCGCLHSERSSARTPALHAANTTHGKSRTPVDSVWYGMRRRCNNPNSKFYQHYGGRGISIEWPDFASFYADMGDPPPGMTIERIDVNGNYSKANCVWATRTEQQNNRRANRLLTFNGRTQNVGQWAKETGIHRNTITQRMDAGYSPEECLSTEHFRQPPMKLAVAASAAKQSARTHCKHGHPFDESNSYWNGRQRVCKACRAARERERRASS